MPLLISKKGGLYAPHYPRYTHREAYTRCTYSTYTHTGRHIPGYTLPTNLHREAYTRVYPFYTQGGIYPGIPFYTHREAYTRVNTSTHTGRHIPGLNLSGPYGIPGLTPLRTLRYTQVNSLSGSKVIPRLIASRDLRLFPGLIAWYDYSRCSG